MINETKILDYLNNELKIGLFKVTEDHSIQVYSSIANVERLIEFVTPLNYYISFIGASGKGFLCINPR